MITQDGWVPMTDEQALNVLKSVKLTIGRGTAKTLFDATLLEALGRAMKALEEKVDISEKDSVCDHCERLIEAEKVYCRYFDEDSCPYRSTCKLKQFMEG